MRYATAELRTLVDNLLAASGEWTMPEMLVALFRLDREDLERWRAGEGELAPLIYGDPAVAARELQEAMAHARSLGLLVEAGPTGHPSGPLPGMAADWAHLRMVPAPAPQMDLFLNAAEPGRAHRLKEALVAHDPGAAVEALDALERKEPGHPLVAVAPQLIGLMTQPLTGASEDWQLLEQASQLAAGGLGDAAIRFMAPRWRALANATASNPAAVQHPSAAWLRVPDWEAVVASIGRDPDAVESPELIVRAATGLETLGEHRDALAWLFALCWRFP